MPITFISRIPEIFLSVNATLSTSWTYSEGYAGRFADHPKPCDVSRMHRVEALHTKLKHEVHRPTIEGHAVNASGPVCRDGWDQVFDFNDCL